MEFFGREIEIEELRNVRETARMTVVTGRRRVGKTELVKKAFDDGRMPCLYLLVTRKPEKVQIYKYQHMIELRRFKELKTIAEREFNQFAGYSLERYFLWKFIDETSFTRIGGWWDRKGENEIDLVCEDEFKDRIDFYEVKTDPSRISIDVLKRKVEAFFAKNPSKRELKVSFAALSLDDM